MLAALRQYVIDGYMEARMEIKKVLKFFENT